MTYIAVAVSACTRSAYPGVTGMPTEARGTTAMDEWVSLFASRDEMAVEYARLLSDPPRAGVWPVLNLAIMDRWSRSGLTYIKRKAWALAAQEETT